MCSVEYKAVYIEKNRLEKKLEKLSKKKSRQQKMSESYVEVEREMTQTAESSDKDEVSSMADLLEMERQIEGFGAEMERGLEKKLKYKTLYKQELDRREELEKQHKLEMAEKLTEIETLKAALKEIPCSKDLKIRALEKCVSDSEKVIDDLNEKLRQSNRGRNDEASLSSSLPRTPGPGSPIYPGYAVLNSPHPQQNPWLLYPQAQSPPHLLFPQTLSTVPYSAQTYPQSPPIQYPAHYPVQRSESTTVTDEAEQTTASLIDKVESDGLEKPLTPLPAPLAPQVMHMAKDAIDESSRPSSLGQQGLQDLSSETGLKVALPDNNIPSAPPADNDRFYDAEGPSMRYCQECNQVFSADVSDQAFEEHQLSHIGAICPFCKKMKSDEMTDQDFEHHVSKHMDDKEQLLN